MHDKKKAVAFIGSPRKNGMTTAMLDRCVLRAQEAGYEVTVVDLYDRHLEYCRGCLACDKTSRCVIKDDIQEITDRILESQLIILASPVYWANVSAVVKNLFDRLRGVAMGETKTFPEPRLKGKKYILLTACNTPAPFSYLMGQSRGAIRNMDEFFHTAGMKSLGKVVCAGTLGKTSLPESVEKKIDRCFK